MIDRVNYYLDLLITLCGFNGNDDSLYIGWTIVILSTGVVVFAFYQAITKAIWPGEIDLNHIKYQIYNESWVEEVEYGEIERAY